MSPQDLTLEQLPELRRRTEAIASRLRGILERHLLALRPAFAPERALGKHVRTLGPSTGRSGTHAFRELKEQFAALAGAPYALPKDLGEGPLDVDPQIEIHPWEYPHEIEGSPTIHITSPTRWILSYRSSYSPAQAS